MREIEKSPVEYHNTTFKKDPPMDAEISDRKFKEKQHICRVAKYFP